MAFLHEIMSDIEGQSELVSIIKDFLPVADEFDLKKVDPDDLLDALKDQNFYGFMIFNSEEKQEEYIEDEFQEIFDVSDSLMFYIDFGKYVNDLRVNGELYQYKWWDGKVILVYPNLVEDNDPDEVREVFENIVEDSVEK